MSSLESKVSGASLIEQVLVIAAITLIIILGIKQYLVYQKEQQIIAIHADVGVIFTALQQYFYRYGCNASGQFQGNDQPDLVNDLHLNNLNHGRKPFINAYSTKIKASHAPIKPFYQLIVFAKSTLPAKAMRVLAKKTDARWDDANQQLKWTLRPGNEFKKISHHAVFLQHLKNIRRSWTNPAITPGCFTCQ